MRHPGLSILLAGGLLVALAIPALQMNIVTSGVDEFPQDEPVIQTYNKVKEAFPIEGVTATVVVEADDVRSGPAARGIDELRAQVNGSEGSGPAPRSSIADGTVAQINVPTLGNGNDAPSTNALNELRDDIIPATVGAVEGTTVNVTGDAAGSQDFANKLNSRLPLIFAFVFGLAFLLLVTFRSIVIPIKVITQPALGRSRLRHPRARLSEGQPGVAARLHLERRGDQLAAMFLFVVLFGLSMDYHVFILSRSRSSTTAACRPMRPSSAGSRRQPGR